MHHRFKTKAVATGCALMVACAAEVDRDAVDGASSRELAPKQLDSIIEASSSRILACEDWDWSDSTQESCPPSAWGLAAPSLMLTLDQVAVMHGQFPLRSETSNRHGTCRRSLDPIGVRASGVTALHFVAEFESNKPRHVAHDPQRKLFDVPRDLCGIVSFFPTSCQRPHNGVVLKQRSGARIAETTEGRVYVKQLVLPEADQVHRDVTVHFSVGKPRGPIVATLVGSRCNWEPPNMLNVLPFEFQ